MTTAGDVVSVTGRTTDTQGRFLVTARTKHFVSDARTGPAEAVQAGELLLSTLASCSLSNIQLHAQERDSVLTGARADISCKRDPQDSTRYEYIRPDLWLEGVTREEAETLAGLFSGGCPIYNTLRRGGHVFSTDLLGRHAETDVPAKSLLRRRHQPVRRGLAVLGDGRRHADDGTLSTQRSSLAYSRILVDLLSYRELRCRVPAFADTSPEVTDHATSPGDIPPKSRSITCLTCTNALTHRHCLDLRGCECDVISGAENKDTFPVIGSTARGRRYPLVPLLLAAFCAAAAVAVVHPRVHGQLPVRLPTAGAVDRVDHARRVQGLGDPPVLCERLPRRRGTTICPIPAT